MLPHYVNPRRIMIILRPSLFLLLVVSGYWHDDNNNDNSSHLWVSGFATGYYRTTLSSTVTTASRIKGAPPPKIAAAAGTTTSLRVGGASQTDDSFSELTSALARLDKEQQQQQRSSKSRWSKLIIPNDTEEYEIGTNQDGTSGAAATSAVAVAVSSVPPPPSNVDYVWMLEPPVGRTPSCIVVFTGGAGLGQFPHIAYNELLCRVSDRLNALVLAAPYSVGLDHFQLAKETGELIRRALVVCQDDPNRPYMSADRPLPTYSLAHSLGCKLQTIYMLATRQDYLSGMGFMAYNNFSFAKTLKMARTFTEEIRRTTTRASRMDDYSTAGNVPFGGRLDSESVINGIFDFAEMAAGAIGVDFSPNAADTERLIQLRYDDMMQSKTRVFVFDDDNLDSSIDFVRACSSNNSNDGNLKVSGLPGGHLSPVFFQWKVDDVMTSSGLDGTDSSIPPEAMDMAKEAMGGFQGASFGDETSLNVLVDEICDWILGKPPKRGPIWAQQRQQDGDAAAYNTQSVPRITDGR